MLCQRVLVWGNDESEVRNLWTEGPPNGRQEMHLTVTYVIAGFRFHA
jgi:hypothetical protein